MDMIQKLADELKLKREQVEKTVALIDEGNLRELVSKIQTMRKEAGFNVMDHIRVTMAGAEQLCALVAAQGESICGDILADSLQLTTPAGYVKEWDVNGQTMTIGVEKV